MYNPSGTRYDSMPYRRCGRSGLFLPAVSLGLWHNFGDTGDYSNMKQMIHTAFDLGITHFDLANNYGHPYNGSAEERQARIFCRQLGINYDKLSKDEFAGLVRILKKSSLLKVLPNKRGKNKPK